MGDDLAQAVAVLEVLYHGQVERRRPDWATRYLFEENGWKLAGTIVPIAYTGWSLWLVATGIVLLA